MALTEQSLDAEYGVLGSLLIDPGIAPALVSRVDPRDFASETCRRLFEAARALLREGSPIDAITVRDKSGLGHDVDALILQLMETTPTAANWEAYADLMHEQSTLRQIRAQAQLLASAPTLDECRAPLEAMQEVYNAGKQLEAWTLEQLLLEFADRQAHTEPKEYITIGLDPIDKNTFLDHGDVLMIGGAPSDGKTAFALVAAYHMAKTHNVGFYSLETGKEKLEDRLVTSGMQIDFSRIKKQQLTDEDWMTFAEKSAEASKRRLTILRAGGLTAEQITNSARARGFDVIFIDYVQLITPVYTRNLSRAEQMAEVSRTLHTFAQTSNTLVVELAQLTRQDRKDKRERDMFDLGESSQFEKDADLILLLYRPPKDAHFVEGDKHSESLDPDKTRILRVAKNKEGMRVRLPLAFDGAHQSFYVLSENPYDAIRRTSREVKKSPVTGGAQTFIELNKKAEGGMPF